MSQLDLAEIVQALAEAKAPGSYRTLLSKLADVDWADYPQERLRLARMLIRKGLARDGLDLLPAPQQPLVPEIEQLRAYGLANTGAPLTAARHLRDLLGAGHEDSETLGLLGRTEKDLARRADDHGSAASHWRRALAYYQRAFELTGDTYPGINAAALSLRLGALQAAARLAKQVLTTCEQLLSGAQGVDEWTLSTKAEALLILGRIAEAEASYQQAARQQRTDLSALGSTVRQARELLRDLGMNPAQLDQAFALPRIAVITGHRIDVAEQGWRRFPHTAQGSVRRAIDALLERHNIGIGFGAAANGADLIFMEALLDRGGEVHLVLPMEVEVFRQYSVAHPVDAQWLTRYDRVLHQASSISVVSERVDLSDPSVFDYGNRVALGLARLKASEIGSEVLGIAVWDGRPGLAGGTGDCVALWRRLAVPVHCVELQSAPMNPLERVSLPPTNPPRQRQLMGMLFADIVGYSRLSEQDIEQFYSQVLPRVAQLSQTTGHSPLVTQTFGDAFYFVFESTRQAAEFALSINRLFRDQLRALSQLDLRIRIALHAGPLLYCFDPLRAEMNYTGRHTSRVARVEPVAPENQILVTQQFAALLALEADGEYDLAYAGERVLPKGYGIERLYVLSAALNRRSAGAG